MAMLEVKNLNAWYGTSHILQGINFEVNQGELVCLIGRNGAGKTTTVKSIAGLIPKTKGSIKFEGTELLSLPAHQRFARGLAYVPEERRIVPGLTVRENIRLGLLASPLRRREAEVIDEIAETFPRLKERLDQQAITMSGGEQQMLAIARAVAAKPKMVLLDGGCAEFCVNGQSTGGASRPVRKHNEHQETRRPRRTAIWPAGQLQEA